VTLNHAFELWWYSWFCRFLFVSSLPYRPEWLLHCDRPVGTSRKIRTWAVQYWLVRVNILSRRMGNLSLGRSLWNAVFAETPIFSAWSSDSSRYVNSSTGAIPIEESVIPKPPIYAMMILYRTGSSVWNNGSWRLWLSNVDSFPLPVSMGNSSDYTRMSWTNHLSYPEIAWVSKPQGFKGHHWWWASAKLAQSMTQCWYLFMNSVNFLTNATLQILYCKGGVVPESGSVRGPRASFW